VTSLWEGGRAEGVVPEERVEGVHGGPTPDFLRLPRPQNYTERNSRS
jgi:hypothetical protein